MARAAAVNQDRLTGCLLMVLSAALVLTFLAVVAGYILSVVGWA